jgi:TonB family protein
MKCPPRRPPRQLRRAAVVLGVSAAVGFAPAAFAETRPRPEHVEVSPPTVIQHVDAVYPASALAEHKHADVMLALTIDADGHVSKVDVLESGGKDLDEAAVAAARQWVFEPAKRGGVAVASRIRLPFHFAPPAPPPEVVETKKEGELPESTATQETPPPPPPPEAEDVTIVGRRPPPSRGASDFNLRVGELSNVPRANATEMLKLAPGILLTNEGGEGHAEQVFMRGFDAREGQDVEFTVGGVPINESGNLHGNGYADTHFIIPELVQRLRVVEGPFDPRQGNYAVAGSADYELGLDKRGITGKYTTGSFGTQRMLLTWGPQAESKRTFAGVELFKTDGYGQNRDAQRASAMGQYEGKLAHGSWRVTTQAYSSHFHSPGVIREDDYQAGRIGFYDSYDQTSYAHSQVAQGGDSSRYSIAADLDSKSGDVALTQQVFLIKRDMRLLENFTGFLLDPQEPLQSLHTQRGDELDLNVNELTIGARGSARVEGKVLDQKQELEVGYFARGDQVGGKQQRLAAATGAPYATETDLDSQLGDLGLYGDASLRGTSWLALRGGVRADLLTYSVLDNCAVHSVSNPPSSALPLDQSCLSMSDRGAYREPTQRSSTSSAAVLPRASILLGPFAHVTLNASVGQGVRSIDPSYVTQDVKTPFASVTAYEAGAGYAHQVGAVDVVARSIFFQTHVDRDLIFSETAGRNVLGVGTTRTGWVGATRLTGKFFDESANVTLVRSAYDDTHLLVAYVPSVVVRSDTAVFGDLPMAIDGTKVRGLLAGGVTFVGPRALPFGQTSDDIFTLDANATLSWRNVELGIMCTNLLDAQYRLGEYNFASSFHPQQLPTLVPERVFTAGAPRGVFGTLAINFGGGA